MKDKCMNNYLSFIYYEKTLKEVEEDILIEAEYSEEPQFGGGRSAGYNYNNQYQQNQSYDPGKPGIYSRIKQAIHRKMSHRIDKKDGLQYFNNILRQFNKYYNIFMGEGNTNTPSFQKKNIIENASKNNKDSNYYTNPSIGQKDKTTYDYLKNIHDYFVNEWRNYHRDYGVDPSDDNPELIDTWREITSKMKNANSVASDLGFIRSKNDQSRSEVNKTQEFFDNIRKGVAPPEHVLIYLKKIGVESEHYNDFVSVIKNSNNENVIENIGEFIKKARAYDKEQKERIKYEIDLKETAHKLFDIYITWKEEESKITKSELLKRFNLTYNMFRNRYGTIPEKYKNINIKEMYDQMFVKGNNKKDTEANDSNTDAGVSPDTKVEKDSEKEKASEPKNDIKNEIEPKKQKSYKETKATKKNIKPQKKKSIADFLDDESEFTDFDLPEPTGGTVDDVATEIPQEKTTTEKGDEFKKKSQPQKKKSITDFLDDESEFTDFDPANNNTDDTVEEPELSQENSTPEKKVKSKKNNKVKKKKSLSSYLEDEENFTDFDF